MKPSKAEEQFGVYLHDELVATLFRREDRTRLVFLDSYSSNPSRAYLGLRFEDENYKTVTKHGRLHPWLSNLLPEGALRRFIASEAESSVYQEVSLLARVGHDLPGAVRVLPLGATELETLPVAWDEGEEIAPLEDDARKWRFSLAGVALKFSMLARGERLTLPAYGERGDWIVKTPDPVHAHVPANEFAMMSLAAAVGIEVPRVRMIERCELPDLPDTVWGQESFAYAIERFDRTSERRLVHIEDFAQVRGFYPELKYKGTFETLAALIYRGRDEDALREFARRLTFNTLIGNGDAHLKNWSLIYRDPRRPTLSPAYDLVSTFVYQPLDQTEDLGLTFGSSKSFDGVGPASFGRLERKLGVDLGLGEIASRVARSTLENIELVQRYLAPYSPDIAERVIERIKTLSTRFVR